MRLNLNPIDLHGDYRARELQAVRHHLGLGPQLDEVSELREYDLDELTKARDELAAHVASLKVQARELHGAKLKAREGRLRAIEARYANARSEAETISDRGVRSAVLKSLTEKEADELHAVPMPSEERAKVTSLEACGHGMAPAIERLAAERATFDAKIKASLIRLGIAL